MEGERGRSVETEDGKGKEGGRDGRGEREKCGNRGREVEDKKWHTLCNSKSSLFTCIGLGVGYDMSQLGKLAIHTNSSKVLQHCGSKVRAVLKRVVMDVL